VDSERSSQDGNKFRIQQLEVALQAKDKQLAAMEAHAREIDRL
jgi:hypothetical protein